MISRNRRLRVLAGGIGVLLATINLLIILNDYEEFELVEQPRRLESQSKADGLSENRPEVSE